MSKQIDENYGSRTADKFVVRLPQGLRDKIRQRANVNHRSMNSDIVKALINSFGDQTSDGVPSIPQGNTWCPVEGALVYATSDEGEVGLYVIEHFRFGSEEDNPTAILWRRVEGQLAKRIARPVSELKPFSITFK